MTSTLLRTEPPAADDPSLRVSTGPAQPSGLTGRELAIVALLALAVRLVHLGHTPNTDELFSAMAARAWLQHGDFCIAHCLHPYSRAAAYTWMVVASMKLFGTGLIAARLPSVLLGALWATAVGWWAGRAAGRTAGWTAGLLMVFDPGAIFFSQISRFYVAQGLFVFLGLAGTYLLIGRPLTRRTILAWVGVAAAYVLALHLLVTTLIGLVGVTVWALLDQAPVLLSHWKRSARFRIGAVAVVLLGGLAFVVGLKTGLLAQLWYTYRWRSMFAVNNGPKYFFDWLLLMDGWLWALFPVAAVIALVTRPRAAGFCLVVFGVGFVAHSMAADRLYRVFYWSVPFFLSIWALTAAALLPPLRRAVARAAQQLAPRPWFAGVLSAAFFAGLVGWLVFTTEAWDETRMMLTRTDATWPQSKNGFRGYPDWGRDLPILKPIADSADVVLSSTDNPALWYLGRVDATMAVNNLDDGHGNIRPDFTIAWQHGIPLIRKPESVERVMACYDRGLLVIEQFHWTNPAGVPAAMAGVIERDAQRVALPSGSDLIAFRWDHRIPHAGVNCNPLPLPYTGVKN